MKIAVLKEKWPNETRVAASPETVKKFCGLGAEVAVEKAAGKGASIPDAAFKEAGASIAATAKAALKGADVVLKVRRPMIDGESEDELANFSKGQALCCQINALTDAAFVDAMAKAGVTGFAMELMPRISRAQSMDILSSQSNLAGYKSVLDAATEFGRASSRRPAFVSWGSALPGFRRSRPRGAWVQSCRRPTCVPPPRSRWNRSARPSSRSRMMNSHRRRPPAAMPRK
jgi:NAD/NADP transhydrogenase alpha subunit